MMELIENNSFFFILLTVAAFCVGAACQGKWRQAVLNPILIGSAIVMLTLIFMEVPASAYQAACKPLSYLMTPATICLGISFAEQVQKLKNHLPAILAGVALGTVCSMGGVAVMAQAFGLNTVLTASLLPKSVTTAIGVVLSEQAGGIGAVTTVAIILSGILCNIAGSSMANWWGIRNPVARGVAFGTAGHVIATSRAMAEGPLCGAVSSLSLTVAGIITSLIFSFVM